MRSPNTAPEPSTPTSSPSMPGATAGDAGGSTAAGSGGQAHGAANWAILAPVLVMCAGVCWGLIGLFSQALAAEGLSSVQITTVRCVLATVCIGLYLAVFRRDAFRFRLRDIWMFLGSGIASIAFFNVCYFTCIARCGLSLAAILLYTAPCFVVLMSAVLFKERITRVKLVALLVAFTGCLFVVGVGSGGVRASALGIAAGVGSGIGYALYSIFGRYALARYSAPTLTFYTFLLAACALLPFSQPGQIVALAASSPAAGGTMLLLALVSTVLPFACYTTGLAHMETGKASIMAFIEPMTALIIAVCVFGETLTPGNVFGIVCIVVAVALLNARAGEGDDGSEARSGSKARE